MVYVLISTITIFSLVCIAVTQTYTYDYSYGSNAKQYTRKITLKQGVLQGVIVELRNHALPAVEQYLGIPYAAAPVGDLRFMPPGSAPSWYGTKLAEHLGPVCPQKLPDSNKMELSRKEYFNRLVKFLLNQSEDCLYLNIYAPAQDPNRPYTKKYPVMVFIHGESFEWNSGNPYDGSVLAAYGDVIVVTLNYRLGILGFLKVGLEETSGSNFGLVDIIAALLWVQENIVAFGGDPNSITLFGHGTGAACISLLMLSPMALREGNPLFNRAILMGGTALSDWALAGKSREVTYRVAEALNCPRDDKLAACLRKKRLNEIMEVDARTEDYTTTFGPIVDGLVIPSDPNKIMSTYNDFFRRFELMYGVTEVESIDLLEAVALTYGLLEKERDHELRKYLITRCEYKPELYLAHTLATYTGTDHLSDPLQGYTGHEPDRASVARDTLLDMLSDARSVAPIALMARYHAAVNPQSYFYVFGHTTASRQFIRNKTTHGEELPYVFGVPLDGHKFHFTDHYNNQERLFSEAVMTLWCNFAYSGDPNIHRKNDYLTLYPSNWKQYDIDWPEFDKKQERYLYLGIPPEVRQHYRSKEVAYWNEILPTILANRSSTHFNPRPSMKPTFIPKLLPKNRPPWIDNGKGTSIEKFRNPPGVKPNDAFGTVKYALDEDRAANSDKSDFGNVVTSPTQTKSGSTAMIVLIVVGGVFLLINVVLCVGLYYKCIKMKSRESSQKRTYEEAMEIREDQPKHDEDDYTENGCSIMKMISKSSKSEGTYEAVKVSEGSSKYKLARQMSASTIDPHTKVRDWIAHEIVQRCSPKFLRRPRQDIPIGPVNLSTAIKSNSLENSHVRTDSKATSYSTLGRSPTRPVSPVEGDNQKSSSIPRPKAQKVSVAIDATPAARSPSVLRQQPIELTKSLDYSTNYPLDVPIRRSNTVDNFLDTKTPIDIRRSATNINLKSESCEIPTIVKIEHYHAKSRSDPVDNSEIYGKKMKTFDPNGGDINVTSKEEDDNITPLTPEESLMTIKRRNFPKVLPDYPDRQQLAHKRRSMPVPNNMFMPIPENPPNSSSTKTLGRYPPPAPPPRSSSSLGRKPNSSPLIQSPVMLAEEPPVPKEPEITCNNLFVGPLLPTRENRKIELITTPKDSYMLDTQPIYDNLRSPKEEETNKKIDKIPKTIITTDPINPIKKNEPKVVIKPVITRNTIDNRGKGITRVTVKDNLDEASSKPKSDESQIIKSTSTTSIDKTNDDTTTSTKVKGASHIPKLIKCSNITKEDSPESSPSEESETGTVIKRV